MLVATVLVSAILATTSSPADDRPWLSPPVSTRLPLHRSEGELYEWSNARAKFVFLIFPKASVRITVDARRYLGRLEKLPIKGSSPLAIVSGGTWTDSNGAIPLSEGLVIAGGRTISRRHDRWPNGGAIVQTRDSVTILPSAALGEKLTATEALESPLLLLENGEINPRLRGVVRADWVAVGVSDAAVIVAFVTHVGKRTTTLHLFAEFVRDIAVQHRLSDLAVINLDGACAAQLYLPNLRRAYACEKPSSTPNRILIWSNE